MCYSPRSVIMSSNTSQQNTISKKRPLRRVHWGKNSTFEYNQNKSHQTSSPSNDNISNPTWYGPADIQSFRDERKIAIKLTKEFQLEDIERSGLATCRGIEHLHSKKSFNERHQRHQLAVQVVRDACIKYQTLTSEKREKMIAIQYASVCLHSKKTAHDRARAYWEETQKVLDSDDDESCIPPPPPTSSSSSSSTKSRKSIKGSPFRGSPSMRRGIRALRKALPVM